MPVNPDDVEQTGKTGNADELRAEPEAVLAPVPEVTPGLDPGYTSAGVPTLDGVREKIETRYATALGAVELAEDTTEGRTLAQRYEDRKQAAAAKLDEIRAAMHDPGPDPESDSRQAPPD